MRVLMHAAAFAAGAWLLQQQPVLPPPAASSVLVPLAALAWFCARYSPTAGQALYAATFGLAGFLWAAAIAGWTLADALPEGWEGRDIRLAGVVADLPQSGARATRFAFDVGQVLTPGAAVPSRVALSLYPQASDGLPQVRAGQRCEFTVRLRRPHGNANPYGFDIEPWLLDRGIRAVGYVRMQAPWRCGDAREWRPGHALAALRERVRSRLLAALADRPYAGIVVALAIGDQRAIPREQWQVFTRTGVNHLMSISGLHITMVAALAFALVMRLWRRLPGLAVRTSGLRAATLIGLLAAIAYAALAGFAVPAQRTVFMLAAVALALWSGWRLALPSVLGIALFAVLLLDPMAVTSAGFWLSFGAVSTIMFAAAGGAAARSWLAQWLHIQWAVTLALVPLLLALFQQVSLVSPLANALAIPVVSLVVAPLALAAIAIPLDAVAWLAHAVMAGLMALLQGLAAWPAATWEQHAPVWWSVPLALAGAGWLLMPRGFPTRWMGAALLLPLFAARPAGPGAGELWVDVLDVGQGLAAIVRTERHALVFDTGPSYADAGDAGERIVVPNLRGAGIGSVDLLMVSHADSDHAGGVGAVLRAVPVDRLLTSAPGAMPEHASSRTEPCVAGQRWEWDGVRFEVLHPEAGGYNSAPASENDRSCVLRVASAYGSVLIPADIERRAEQRLVKRHGTGLATDVLLAPHHGSRTSSTKAFVEMVRPEYVIVAAGYRNRFGHPHPAVSARYRAAGAKVLRTDQHGAVQVRMRSGGPYVYAHRESERRYWHGR